MTRLPHLFLRLVLVLLALLAISAAAGWWAVRGSLAQLDGQLSLPGLSTPVRIERDGLGTVTVQATNEADAARALGYVHGQERFFEMDLLRRSAAGELSELFGAVALEKDKSIRVHRLRHRITHDLPTLAGNKLPMLVAYSEGVNAGRKQLRTRPWPYLLLRAPARDWQPVDSLLVGYAMFFDLQDESNSRELALWKIKQVIPDALYRILNSDGTQWDAPLRGAARGNVALPDADQLDLRKLPAPANDEPTAQSEQAAPGSNNFAVAGKLTADGRAIVAGDMHLTTRAPNIWFRARMVYDDANAPNGKVDVSGFTLPGIPTVIVGSNGHVAWSFTNSYGDWLDFYQVHWTDDAHSRYRTADGERSTRVVQESIVVKGGTTQSFAVRETIWGPITSEQDSDTSLALRWAAHQPGAINLGLSDLATAPGLDVALQRAGSIGMPAQNLVIADSSGRIAWRLTAQMPQRTGHCDKQAPIDPLDGCEWKGWRPARDNPAFVDPPSGRLWTANARTVGEGQLDLLGDAGYANGARARQIRDGLFSAKQFSERDLLAIQLDDRALLLKRWWELLRMQAKTSRDPTWVELEAATREWEGRATPDSTSYLLVREWRLAVLDRIKHGLMAPAIVALGDQFVMPDLPQIEGVGWQLVSQRPAHLLPKTFASWDALLLDAAKFVSAEHGKRGPLKHRRWAEHNAADVCHPLAKALPSLASGWLCMPPDALPGDLNMPRIATPTFGASQRMVVSPGREQDGIIHMPGGQSGNPLSPFWGAGHAAWVKGEPTPFLPGASTHTLLINPKAAP